MEKLYSNILGTFVMENEGKRPIALVRDVLIDPEKGLLVAFIVNLSQNLVIVPIDVIKWGDMITVNSADAITEGEDVIRVKKIQDKGIYLQQNRVETEEGEYLGQVQNFAVNSKTLEVQSIYVAKSFLGLLKFGTRIISSKRILEITKEKVIVRGNMVKDEELDEKAVVAEDLSVA